MLLCVIPFPWVPPNLCVGLPTWQVLIFAQKLSCSKKHHFRKSAEFFRFPDFILCEPNMNIHSDPSLWKTPVEKPVENVENSELSTGISVF